MKRLLPVVLSLGLLSGCSLVNGMTGGRDNALPASELKPLAQALAVQTVWQASVGSGSGESYLRFTPAALNDKVFAAGPDGEVVAWEAASGRQVWQVETDLELTAGVGTGDGLVLVATRKGVVLALDADNGQERWRGQVSSEVLAPPRAAGGVTLVRSGDGRFTAFASASGERRWVYSAPVPALSLRGSAAPILGDGLAVAGLDSGKVVALRLSNGQPLFEKTLASPRGRTELERMVDIDSEPRVVEGVLYTSAYQGNVSALDLRNGNVLWNRDFSSHSGLGVDKRQVYLSDQNDTLWALDRESGAPAWSQQALNGRRLSAPALYGPYIVVGDYEGYLHWLQRADGQLVARARVSSEGVLAAPLVQNGTLYVLDRDGQLSAFRIAGESQ